MSADYAADVAAALDKLGATSAAIAQSLANKGIKARRVRASSCALAVYVGEQFPEAAEVGVSPWAIHIYQPAGQVVTVALSPAQTEFIHGFDAGDFPDLIAP